MFEPETGMSFRNNTDLLDELTIEIDTISFDLRLLLARYVAERLLQEKERSLAINLSVFILEEDTCRTLAGKMIYIDSESSAIFIQLESGENVPWDDLSVSAQDVIVREIHHNLIASRLLHERNDKDIN